MVKGTPQPGGVPWANKLGGKVKGETQGGELMTETTSDGKIMEFMLLDLRRSTSDVRQIYVRFTSDDVGSTSDYINLRQFTSNYVSDLILSDLIFPSRHDASW